MRPPKIRLLVCGARGRMGTRILALAHQDPRFGEIVGVDRDDDLNAGLEGSDVVIDFSDPHSTFSIAKTVAQSKRALVIGTTGLSLKTLSQVKTLSKKIPIVFSPNMSVGMNVLFDLVAKAARILAAYDIEVVEAHHHLKKDAPSGSAMKLAEVAAQASYRNVRDFVYGRQGLVGERTKKEIGISAVRAGDIVGDHTVLLAGPGERLELTHRAHSRDAFASGALEAAAWGVGRKPGLYAMKDVLNI